MAELSSFEAWIARYAELVRARIEPDLLDAANGAFLPENVGWWEDHLSESLEGMVVFEGPPEDVSTPVVPAVVAEVGAEEQSPRTPVRELFQSLFAHGSRAYAGPTLETCGGDEWDVLSGPFFVVVLEGRRVAYEGEWVLAELVIGDEDGPRGLHERLVRAVRAWEAGA